MYIDSRFKSSDSASHSDFKIHLPISFIMPEDTGFYIDDVCIPHTWYPSDARNNLVSFQYNGANLFAYVPPGNYSTSYAELAIATAMNEQMATIISVTTERFQPTYNSKTNQLSIGFVTGVNNRSKFEIYTDEQLRTIRPSLFWLGKTMNTLLKNTTSQVFFLRWILSAVTSTCTPSGTYT